MRYISIFILSAVPLIFFSEGCSPVSDVETATFRHHKEQFRGVWIATVRNLDWPSKPGLTIEQMKQEYTAQLDMLQSLNMNAVIVQIRPSGDALYASEYEPWAYWLTGKQGQPLPGDFDPLPLLIEEAHKRCLEFHAWFNPYRGVRDFKNTVLAETHIYHQHPEWFVQYGEHLYFDPGVVPARKFVEKVIADVVTRYDVDAVHFDDYYYPYRLEGIEFPDTMSFRLYPGTFSVSEKDNWRRNNINLLVRELHDTINQLKPWVHFGISPFGVWRNKEQDPRGSATFTVQNNYDDLYGDAIKWVEEGWLDYIIPQCYQFMGRPIMDYRVVTQWWNENHASVNYYIGQGPFRLGTTDRGARWTEGNEIDRQMYYNDSVPDLRGSAFFRSLTFMDNPSGINDSLRIKFYKFPALTPPSHHDAERKCSADFIEIEIGSDLVSWKLQNPENARYVVIYTSENIGDPQHILAMSSEDFWQYSSQGLQGAETLFLTVVDKFRVESSPRQIAVHPSLR